MMNKKLFKDLDKMSKSDLRFICRELGVTVSGNKSKKQLVSLLLKPLKRKYKMKNYFPIWNNTLKNVNGCNFCLQKLRSEGLLASTSNDMAFGANLNYDRLWKLTEGKLQEVKHNCQNCHNNLKRLKKSPVKDDLTRFFRIIDDNYNDIRDKNLKNLKKYSEKRTEMMEQDHKKQIKKLEADTQYLQLISNLKNLEIPKVDNYEEEFDEDLYD